MTTLSWQETDRFPDGFLSAEMSDIPDLFSQPTLVNLPGEGPALFVSIVLHGNEDAGLLAVQDLLRRNPRTPFARPLSVFVGNVEACRAGVRYLPHQVDFNRAWPGSDLPPTPIHEMLDQVTQRMLKRGVFASIDIHNNTGRNPIYGCICSCAAQHVHLASLFSSRIIYFIRPKGVQTQAFMPHCPAMTCECGRPGDRTAAKAAANLLDKLLRIDTLQPPARLPNKIEVYHSVARVQVRDTCSVGFEPGNDIVFRPDLDTLNFRPLSRGEMIGQLSNSALSERLEECFLIQDEHGRDVTTEYIGRQGEYEVLQRDTMPSMLTRDLQVIRQDCLGYFMQRLPHHDGQPTDCDPR